MSAISNSNTFSITLLPASDTKNYQVRAIDVHISGVKHRVSFSQMGEIDAVFSSVLAQKIHDLLGRIDQPNMVFSQPDQIVELHGLVLGRLRMLVSTSDAGKRSVSIRFAQFVGQYQAAFSSSVGLDAGLPKQQAIAESAMFLDIATPILNIVRTFNDSDITSGMRKPLEARLKKLHIDTEEFRFYLELLRRHTEQNRDVLQTLAHPQEFRLTQSC